MGKTCQGFPEGGCLWQENLAESEEVEAKVKIKVEEEDASGMERRM